MKSMNVSAFKEKIYDFPSQKEFKGTRPCVIDFYADWCQPCKTMHLILTQLEKEYPDVDFYQVDSEAQYQLTEHFQIKSLPTLILVSAEGIKKLVGFSQKSKLEEVIREQFHLTKLQTA